MPRIFFALWPDADLRARLADAQHTLRGHPGRAVPARNLHLTLVFMGDVQAGAMDALASGAAAVRSAPFDLSLDRRGCFPEARVAWLAPSLVPPALAELAIALRALAAQAGLSPDPRPYAPHVTLLRHAAHLPDADIPPIRWPARDFCLVESTRGVPGSAYRVRGRWPLIAR